MNGWAQDENMFSSPTFQDETMLIMEMQSEVGRASEKNWSFTGIIFRSVEIESCCTTKMVRNTFCIC